MHAEIRTVRDPETRVQIVEQRSNFDSDPDDSLKCYPKTDQDALKTKIVDAQNRLSSVELSYGFTC